MLHRLIALAFLTFTLGIVTASGCGAAGPACPARPGLVQADYIFAGNVSTSYPKRPARVIVDPTPINWFADCPPTYVCAQNKDEAMTLFLAALDGNGTDLFVVGGYWNFATAHASAPAANEAWASSGSWCIGGGSSPADAGAPDAGFSQCAWLGDVCNDHFENPDSPVPDCCPTQTVTTRGPSTLICDNNLATGDGICAIELWQPCNPVVDDCSWLGAFPTTCKGVPGDEFCCADVGQPCYPPDTGLPNSGCCNGLSCVFDAIGNGYWCQ